jgi:hypothetical protein
VYAQNCFSFADIGHCHYDLTVKATGSEQGGIENIGPIGRGKYDYAVLGVKTVHFNKHLVKRLFALVMPAAVSGAAGPAYRVKLVYENDAGGAFTALFKKIADAARTDTDKHFHKVASRNIEKSYVCFAGDSPREHGFTGSGHTDEQNTLGYAGSHFDKLLGILEKFNHFLQFVFGFFLAGNIVKRNLLVSLLISASLALAELEGTVSLALGLPYHQNDKNQKKQGRRKLQNVHPEGNTGFAAGHPYPVFFEQGHQ